MNARKQMTVKSTYALVVMSVVFAVVGFTTGDKSIAQITALTATLAIFAWLLSETLETYLEHRQHGRWRQYSALGLGLFLLGVEIHLVHFGVGWLFPELSSIMHYLISAGFSCMTVFAKATFGYSYPAKEEPAEDRDLAEILESIEGTLVSDKVAEAA